MNSRTSQLLATMLWTIGTYASADNHKFVSITVNRDGRTCTVQNMSTSCMTLADVLVQELGIAHSVSLSVSAEGCGRDASVRARTVANNLKAAGFSRVAVGGWMTEPNTPCVP